MSLSIALENSLKVADGMNTKGIFLMLLSMATFALADTLIKMSGSFLSPAQIMFFLLGGGLILFAMIAVIQGDSLKEPRAFAPVLLLRYFLTLNLFIVNVMPWIIARQFLNYPLMITKVIHTTYRH